MFRTVLFFFVATVYAAPFHHTMDAELRVSGSFLEYRNSHLHKGVDFRTYGVNGIAVFAPENGYVAAIHGSGQRYGFGRALYFAHEKYTTVLGHLDSLAEDKDLEASWQLLNLMGNEKFFIRFPEKYVQYKKGDIIARAGEAGIGLPHLHVEVKEGNGLFHNLLQPSFLEFSDRDIPILEYVRIFTPEKKMVNDGTVQACGLKATGRSGVVRVYECPETILVDGKTAVKVQGYDNARAVNRIGFAEIFLFLENSKIFEYNFQSIASTEGWMNRWVYDSNYTSFSPTRYTYNIYWPEKATIPSFVRYHENNGWIDTSPWKEGETKTVRVQLSDAYGNSAIANVRLKKGLGQNVLAAKQSYNLAAGKAYSRNYKGLQIETPKLSAPHFLSATAGKAKSTKALTAKSSLYHIRYAGNGKVQPAVIFIAHPYSKKITLYHVGGTPVSDVWYNKARKAYAAEVSSSVRVYLAQDNSAPKMWQVTLNGPLEQKLFELGISETGSGIDPNSFEVYLDGAELSEKDKYILGVRYDYDRKAFLMNTGLNGSQQGRLHHIWIRSVDMAGNRSSVYQGYVLMKY